MKTILIIEDDTAFRMMEKDILEEKGYKILEAENAKDGVSLAIKEIPDLIIMDIKLPNKKRGIGAARLIRSNERTCHIPVIFVTAYIEGEETKEVENIPNHAYITKPFKIRPFLKCIERYINKQKDVK